MMEALEDVAGVAPEILATATLVFLRVGAAMALLPAFGEQMIPLRVRLAATLAFTAVIFPVAASEVARVAESGAGFLSAAVFEVLSGLGIGFAVRVLVMTLQIAGTIAAQATSLSQLFGGAAVDPQPAIGVVLVLGALALASMLGLHVKIAEMFILSYEVFPTGDPIEGADFALWGVQLVSVAMQFAVVLASPFLLASLVYNLALGVINRAMPQLMVAFVGAPAITFGALAILALTAPLILIAWNDALDLRLFDLRAKP